ncbi:helix-turn-helix domain-containing protein [Streptomyces kutzneri]|uniref:helix-turn-helix domain-containing protein n=1 Tax=Streptomyces kutzneri TaxID=3051179 RepID=UPI0028D6E6AE|nr:helix-turn-helix transcriptional regulator [Streptomyces sp. DSM 40907]
MGRPEKPVDQTIPELALLATFLREERAKSNKGYAVLATCTGVSEATLKRAAAGKALPTWRTVGQYVYACHVQGSEPIHVRIAGLRPFDRYSDGSQDALSTAQHLWSEADKAVEDAKKPRPRPTPTCRLVYDQADLSARLRELHKWAGSPSAHTMEARAGDFGALPHSTAHRIIKGQTIPGHPQQLQGFLRACGLPEKQWKPWIAAWWQASDIRLINTVGNKMHLIIETLVKQALDEEKGLAA